MTKEKQWIAYRDGEVCGIFENRKQAVKWLKGLLNQTLKDFENQDKGDEYDYKIEINRLVIEPYKERGEHLGL